VSVPKDVNNQRVITSQILPNTTERHLYTNSTTAHDSENKGGTHKKIHFQGDIATVKEIIINISFACFQSYELF